MEANDGETFNIGSYNEVANIDVVHKLCVCLKKLAQISPKTLSITRI